MKAEYEYDPFGGIIKQTGTAASSNPFRFSTKYLDDETGLSYYGFRYYDAEMGRWTSRDPIAERGGLLLYGFVQNGPVNGYDVLGQSVLGAVWSAIKSAGVSLWNLSWAASEATAKNAFAVGVDGGVSLVVGPVGFKAGANIMWFPEKCELAAFKYASGALAPTAVNTDLGPVETWLETTAVGLNVGASSEVVAAVPLGIGVHDANSWLGWFTTGSVGASVPGIPVGVSGSVFASGDWMGVSAGMGLTVGLPLSGDISKLWFEKMGWDGDGYWECYENKCMCMALRRALGGVTGVPMTVLTAVSDLVN